MSVHAKSAGPPDGESATLSRSLRQLMGSPAVEQSADQPDTIARWAGRLHVPIGSNMRSWRTKFWA